MSLDNKIGDPFTLATLTKPVSSTNGRAHAAGVCSISGIKKRKRTEIAIGLDGEGVSVYSLQNPQLITSYALPPSVTFTAAPYSIYRKGTSKAPSHRFTYASVIGATQVGKSQLVCFQENILGDKADTAKTTYTPSNNAQILALDVLPVAPGGSSRDVTHDVLATFDNGDVICLSANLETVRWVANLASLASTSSSGVQLEYITVATAKSVARGLLRGREDISTVLLPPSTADPTLPDLTQVLCALGRKANGSITLSLFQIQSRSVDLATPQLSPLKLLVSWQLPQPIRTAPSTSSLPQYTLHAATGVLYVVAGESILSYSFSGITPTLSSELSISGHVINSLLRLSQDSVLTAGQRTLRILDVKYGSLQALRSVQSSTTSDTTSPAKKRKVAHVDAERAQSDNYRLVAYHAEANLIVALQENEIIGMQYDTSIGRKRTKVESTLLLDALGKGLTPQVSTLPAQSVQSFQERKAKLDRYASKGKISKFEQAFATDLGIEFDSTNPQAKRENEVNGGPLTNGVGPKIPEEDAMAIDQETENGEEDELRKWQMPESTPDARRQQYDQYALYALSRVFSHVRTEGTTKQSSGSLKVQFFPPNVFQWLLHTGYLTKESIRRAVDQEMSQKAAALSAITDRDIVKALVDFDPDLHILSAILNDDQHLSPGAVVQVIKLLMRSLDDQPKADETTKLLTNGTTQSEDEMDVDISSELEAATHEIDRAMSILDQGLLVRSNTLRPALIRLHRFSPGIISSTLRSTLPRRDLESLIRLLHLEMKNGGWSTSYDFVDPDISPVEAATDAPDDNAVAIIASLLSCTLDAIGAGAWLASVGSAAGAEASDDLIQILHEDTSEALNGFWEARYMRGLLSEFLRFASNVPKSQKPSGKRLESLSKPFAVTKDEDDLPMLPLGAKPDMGVERMKAGKGGRREERSKREMGMLISKRVPKYSFERIVI